tara:strand:+ start:22302 stop:22895 length:594 start_codon:yes stop_codon:yes gene_type:complete
MSELQSIFGGSFDVESNYEEESSGSNLLPNIKGAVLMIADMPEILDNNKGWKGLKFKFLVLADGEYNGKYNGKEKTYNITIANTNHKDSAEWGKQELARLANACGIKTLAEESQFFQQQFVADIGRKVNKKQTEEAKSLDSDADTVFDQTFTKLKALQATQAPQQNMTQAPQQPQYQPAPQQNAMPNNSAPANPFAK